MIAWLVRHDRFRMVSASLVGYDAFGRWRVGAALWGVVLGLWAPAYGDVDVVYQDLREALEVQRASLRSALQEYLRAPETEAFPKDPPGKAFRTYWRRALESIDANKEFPEVAAALRDFDGTLPEDDEVLRYAMGALLGDYLQVRYGEDITRELATLCGFRTYGSVIEPNSEAFEFRKAFRYLERLAADLGLEVRNHGNETLEITLPATGAASNQAAIALFTHIDVLVPVERKWNETTPPFALTMTPAGRWVGLGAYANKGPTILALFALRVLRDADLKLARPVTLLVGATANDPGAHVSTNLAPLERKPALVLAADGFFPFATGEKGDLLARVSSRRGMKTREGIRPGQFYVYRLSCNATPNAVPAEARAWMLYEYPNNTWNRGEEMVNHWREKMEGWQKRHPETRFATYIDGDTLHFFALGEPAHAERPGRNAILDLAAPLTELGIYNNSAAEILTFINRVFDRDNTGATAGLSFTHPEMGGVNVNPVQFDRLANEVTVYIDVRWPVGHDSDWVREKLKKIVADYNAEHRTELQIGFEPGTREPKQQSPPAAVTTPLVEAFELASGAFRPAPAAVSHASLGLFPDAVPFGPEFPNAEKHGHTRNESISPRELADIGVAYTAALAWFATAQQVVSP